MVTKIIKAMTSEKAAHSLWAAVATPPLLFITHLIFSSFWAYLSAFVIMTALFVIKETWDKNKAVPTGFSWADMVFNYIGFAYGIMMYLC